MVKFVDIRNAHAKNYDFGPFPDFRTPWISMHHDMDDLDDMDDMDGCISCTSERLEPTRMVDKKLPVTE